MLFFKSKEQKEQERHELFRKKMEEQERAKKLQESLSLLNKEQHNSKIIIEEIYRKYGISIYYPCSTVIVDEGYLSDDVIDDLCLFTEEERKSLHKWAKVYKDCERLIIAKMQEYMD